MFFRIQTREFDLVASLSFYLLKMYVYRARGIAEVVQSLPSKHEALIQTQVLSRRIYDYKM
jgi:hypothetical protein